MTQSVDVAREIEARVRAIAGQGELPLHVPHADPRNSHFVTRALETSGISVDEGILRELASELGEIVVGTPPVLTSSGTAALHLALLSVGVSPGSKVVCPAISFVATVNSILYCGAYPEFVDVDADDSALSPVGLRAFLEGKSSTNSDFKPGHPDFPKAIVAVSVFGLVPKVDALELIAQEFSIPLVIDGAGALGSASESKSLLMRGDVAIASFNGNKIVTAGGGGAVFSNSRQILETCRHLSKVAKIPHTYEYEHDQLGFNYRMPAINAALLMDQLSRFSEILNKKRALHESYVEAFRDFDLDFFDDRIGTRSNYWLNSARFKSVPVDHVCSYLNNEGVGARRLWKPLPSLPHLSKFGRGKKFPVADLLYKSTLSLPSSYHLGN